MSNYNLFVKEAEEMEERDLAHLVDQNEANIYDDEAYINVINDGKLLHGSKL